MASSEPAGEPGGEAKPSPGKGGKLESLPKEDLIKYIKKQAAINQKTKAKCEELTKKLQSLEKKEAEGSSLPAAKDDGKLVELQEEVASLKEEREEMLAAYNAVQQQQLQTAEMQQKMEETLQKNRRPK